MCYNTEAISWYYAERACNDYFVGGLASFKDKSHLLSLLTLRDDISGYYVMWFGLNSLQNESNANKWQYSDGLQTNYTNWIDNTQPDDDEQLCGMRMCD